MIADLLINFLLRRTKGEPRIIATRDGKGAYLTRYFLTEGAAKTEGMDRHAADAPKWGLYLHHFHRGDDGAELHNHPWKWAVSLILKGGYSEERRVPVDDRNWMHASGHRVVRRDVLPWTLNFLRGEDFHRADMLVTRAAAFDDRGAWTLFLVGPIVQSWGFWDRETGRFTPWKKFLGIEA